MSQPPKFEDIGAWQLVREVAHKSNQQSSIINPILKFHRFLHFVEKPDQKIKENKQLFRVLTYDALCLSELFILTFIEEDIMSVADFKKLGQMCAENEDIRKKAKEIGIDNLDGIIAYGKELGLDFSVDDMKALADEAGITEGELSEEQLEKVAGGVVTTTALAAVSAVSAVVVAGTAVGSEASRNW